MRWLENILRWFRRSKVYTPIFPAEIQFIGEQDGLPEQDIKAEWSPILMEYESVVRAYLAIAKYDQCNECHVVLGLRSASAEDLKLVKSLAQPFHKTFSSRQMLDVVFLTEPQEQAILRVCRPFFQRVNLA